MSGPSGLRSGYQTQLPEGYAYALVKLLGENAIPIMDEEPIAVVRGDCFAQLLQRLVRRGVCRHVAVQDATRGVFHDHKDVEEAKGGGDRNTEITDHDRLRVIADRCLPALGWCAVASAIVEALRYLDRAAMGSCSAPHAEQWTAAYGAAGPG